MSVDIIEIMINLLYGTIAPLALAWTIPLKLALASEGSSARVAMVVLVATAVLSGILILLIAQQGRSLQRDEHGIALRNFLFENWIEQTHEQRPAEPPRETLVEWARRRWASLRGR